MLVEVWIGLAAMAILLATILMQRNKTREIQRGKRRGKQRAHGLYGGPGGYDLPSSLERGSHGDSGGDGGGDSGD